MLIDAREIEAGRIVDADVCIVGAGAAGISIAREFLTANTSVALLEGGGFDYDELSLSLYQGEATGTYLDAHPSYATTSRLRYFGGSTNHWAGWCRPLDALDFEKRPWVPHSGWPFHREHLEPYYRRAAPIVEITPFRTSEKAIPPGLERAPFPAAGSDFEAGVFHMSPPTRFGERYRQELVDSEAVRVFLHANVTNLELGESGERVTQVEVTAEPGRSFHVRARLFVLCAGGIENARILLFSNGVQQNGVGNRHDLVGRYFMDHPHVTAGHVSLSQPEGWFDSYRYSTPSGLAHRAIAVMKLSETAQKRHRVANSMIFFKPPKGRVPTEILEASRKFRLIDGTRTAGLRDAATTLAEDLIGSALGSVVTTLRMRAEPLPNPASRVTLTNERDRLGKPKIKVDFQLLADDSRNLQKMVRLLSLELGRSGIGRARPLLSQDDLWRDFENGDHHMGTTRMHDDPKHGVTDRDCRVHGVSNLFIAGSSTFPTAGFANPTLTILALALRLADHLKLALDS